MVHLFLIIGFAVLFLWSITGFLYSKIKGGKFISIVFQALVFCLALLGIFYQIHAESIGQYDTPLLASFNQLFESEIPERKIEELFDKEEHTAITEEKKDNHYVIAIDVSKSVTQQRDNKILNPNWLKGAFDSIKVFRDEPLPFDKHPSVFEFNLIKAAHLVYKLRNEKSKSFEIRRLHSNSKPIIIGEDCKEATLLAAIDTICELRKMLPNQTSSMTSFSQLFNSILSHSRNAEKMTLIILSDLIHDVEPEDEEVVYASNHLEKQALKRRYDEERSSLVNYVKKLVNQKILTNLVLYDYETEYGRAQPEDTIHIKPILAEYFPRNLLNEVSLIEESDQLLFDSRESDKAIFFTYYNSRVESESSFNLKIDKISGDYSIELIDIEEDVRFPKNSLGFGVYNNSGNNKDAKKYGGYLSSDGATFDLPSVNEEDYINFFYKGFPFLESNLPRIRLTNHTDKVVSEFRVEFRQRLTNETAAGISLLMICSATFFLFLCMAIYRDRKHWWDSLVGDTTPISSLRADVRSKQNGMPNSEQASATLNEIQSKLNGLHRKIENYSTSSVQVRPGEYTEQDLGKLVRRVLEESLDQHIIEKLKNNNK